MVLRGRNDRESIHTTLNVRPVNLICEICIAYFSSLWARYDKVCDNKDAGQST